MTIGIGYCPPADSNGLAALTTRLWTEFLAVFVVHV